MFSVPKSASILFGIGDSSIQRAVLESQAAAVRSALTYLEMHACRTRRGAGGYELVPGDGFVGAAQRPTPGERSPRRSRPARRGAAGWAASGLSGWREQACCLDSP